MRRVFLLAVLVLGLAACGGSGASKDAIKITVGSTGGTMIPWSVTIAPDGTVTTQGNPPVKPTALTSEKAAELSRLVGAGIGKLSSLLCGRTFPDESSLFITANGKTVTVRGTCEPSFTKLWYALTNALKLNQ